MGSCFADRMGVRLKEAKIPTNSNPLGIVYNPISIHNLLKSLWDNQYELRLRQSPHALWHSFDLHSSFSGFEEREIRKRIKATFADVHIELRKANLLIFTFGTAYVYRRKDTGDIVANCHKYPADFFEKSLLTVEEILAPFQDLFAQFFQHKPQLNIILTVSPIRHLKEGLANNTLSKSILRLACHQLSETFEEIAYFPAFEIMLDDLRDYRFYQDDFIHPTSFAEDYIWAQFVKHYFSDQAKHLLAKWEKIQKSLAHRPLQKHSDAHHQFLLKLLENLKSLNTLLDCQAEIEEVTQRLRK